MFPSEREAGIAGVSAGAGLVVEFALFMASGWTPDTFADPASALAFLDAGGTTLRAAAFAGFVNLGFTALFLAGLAGALRRAAPTRAATVLYLGLIGVAAHALVPLGLWVAPATFLDLFAERPEIALGGWAGFSAFLDAAGGLGSLFGGVALTAAGSAIVAVARVPRVLGWVGVAGGTASALTVMTSGTPAGALVAALYMPSLMLTMGFRIWAGLMLWRGGIT